LQFGALSQQLRDLAQTVNHGFTEMNASINGIKSDLSGKIKVLAAVTHFYFHFPFNSDVKSEIQFLGSFAGSSMFGETIG
jgi:hypothetical protein